MLTDSIEGFWGKAINYNEIKVSFHRWLVIQIDTGNMSHQEARKRFSLPGWEYKKIRKKSGLKMNIYVPGGYAQTTRAIDKALEKAGI